MTRYDPDKRYPVVDVIFDLIGFHMAGEQKPSAVMTALGFRWKIAEHQLIADQIMFRTCYRENEGTLPDYLRVAAAAPKWVTARDLRFGNWSGHWPERPTATQVWSEVDGLWVDKGMTTGATK